MCYRRQEKDDLDELGFIGALVSRYGVRETPRKPQSDPRGKPTAESSKNLPSRIERRSGGLIFLLCAIALSLRLYFAFASPNLAHPDEIFQNQEQAHRLVYGYGIVPWEFREGVRSWILPGLLAAVFKTSDLALPVIGWLFRN